MLLNLLQREMIEPFNQAHSLREKILSEIQFLDITPTSQPVKVDMIDGKPAVVFIDQRERRTSNPRLLAYLQPFRDAPDKTGLSTAQLSAKSDDLTASEKPAQSLAPPAGFGGRFG